MPLWLISEPVRLLAINRTISFETAVPAVDPSTPRRTWTTLVVGFGSLVNSTRSPEASSRTSPFMNALASTRLSCVSELVTGAASMAIRLRKARLTIEKVVEPVGTRGTRVTSGQRFTNQLIATTCTSLRIWAWLSIYTLNPLEISIRHRTEDSRGWSEETRPAVV